MKIAVAYSGRWTSGAYLDEVVRNAKKKWPASEIDVIDYSKTVEFPFENGYDAIVLVGQGRFVPPVACKRILRKLEAKIIPIYVLAFHSDTSPEVLHYYLGREETYQPGVKMLIQLSEKDLDGIYDEGMLPNDVPAI